MDNTISDIRKKWVVSLLFAACILSMVIIFVSKEPITHTIHELAEIDEIITGELLRLQLSVDNIRAQTIQVDSLFERKNYIIDVPRGFPVTTFHARIARKLQPNGINITGYRTFPEQTLDLDVTFADKLVRRVRVRYIVDAES